MPRTQKLGIIKGNKSISNIITAAGTRKLGPGGLAQFLTEQFPILTRGVNSCSQLNRKAFICCEK